jgi:hypothetical protein
MTTIHDDMVERVARAICNASSAEWRTGTFSVRSGKNFEWEEHPLDPYNNHWRSKARAAIEAMQPAMITSRLRFAEDEEGLLALYPLGDMRQIYVNEGDLVMLQMNGIAHAIRSQS